MPGPTATILLPARTRLSGRPLPEATARALGRADRFPPGGAGEQAQLLRHFDLLPRGFPVAALTRALDAGDARSAAWLRADPAHVRADINGARLLACGEGLRLDQQDAAALLPTLRPLFGDAGFPIDAPVPDRWYLRLPVGARLPRFPSAGEALGADLLDLLPDAGADAGPEARRWRALLSEAEVALHNHPHNAARLAAGRLPVNSLWLWGAGIVPDHVTTNVARIASDDTLLRAFAHAAGAEAGPRPPAFAVPEADSLLDLRDLRDPDVLHEAWLGPAIAAVQSGAIKGLVLDAGDGSRFALERGQRWRFWRRPARALDA